ncbi:MAG: ribonuclease HII [Ruminococcus sp.]|nr:ribonuclease HII [Candidatus Apopatosoma intestinale]
MMLDYTYEIAAAEKGYRSICGVDEAGRGPLAGNVVAAAVIMPEGLVIDGLNDSKKVSPKKREALFEIITRECVYAIAWATPKEIDELNILGATMLAMRRAIEALPTPADFALIDGNRATGFAVPTETVIGGDAKSPSIAAASILAKVTRDRQCLELDARYPEYGFAGHKGYPTKEHMQKVMELGPCPEHRRSFLSFTGRKEWML